MSLSAGPGRRRPLGAAVALSALLLLGTACFTRPAGNPQPELEDRVRPMAFSLRVAGAVQVRVEEEALPVRTLVLLDPRLSDIRLFSLVPSEPMKPAPGIQVRAGFDLVGFDGDGRYTIGPGGAAPPTSVGPGAQNLSGVRLDYLGDGSPNRVFTVVVATPCVVRIERSGAAGELRCDRLAEEDGAEVSLVLRWRPAG